MARKKLAEIYVVQPFWLSPTGPQMARPREFKEEQEARLVAEEIAPVYLGVVVYGQQYAPGFDFVDEPRLLASFGEVPEVG